MGRQRAGRADPDRAKRPTTIRATPTSCDTGGNGNGFSYCVIAIAAFVITGYTQPAVDQINGRFIGTIPYSVNGNSNVPGAVTQPPTTGSNFYYLGLAQYGAISIDQPQ